jgi:hypothetical protein
VSKTITLTPEGEGVLVVELNIMLRERNLAWFMAKELNDIFKQITGFDHESMAWRRPPVKPESTS